MAKPHYPQIQIQDAILMFRNFAGEPNDYNAPGDRNCCVIVDEQTAAELAAIGWNVRTAKTTDPDIIPGKFIKFTVNLNAKFPPQLWMIRPGRRAELVRPEEYNILDYAKFSSVGLKINQYVYSEKPQKISGFLEEAFFELEADPMRDRYIVADGQA